MARSGDPLRETRVSLLIGTAHYLSHFYMLCLPPLFITWRHYFGVGFATLGLAVALISLVAAILQTPIGFLVDHYGARRFLVPGAALMAVSVAAMASASAYWQVLLCAACAGIGNSVIHPCDYAILSSAISKARTGKAFSLHTFAGNAGYASGPPIIIGLTGTLGWRAALLLVGLIGVLLAGTIFWQGKILINHDPVDASARGEEKLSGRALLFTPTMLLFLLFYIMNSMGSTGIQAWLITVLHKARGTNLTVASWLLTLYLVGVSLGVLVGGWLSDRTGRYLLLLTVTILPTAALTTAIGVVPLSLFLEVLCCFLAGIFYGASRTPRDMMVRRASPPGQVGTVFGFVSSGLPLGSAITPVPLGFLIGMGMPALVLVIVALIMVLSVIVASIADRVTDRQRAWAVTHIAE